METIHGETSKITFRSVRIAAIGIVAVFAYIALVLPGQGTLDDVPPKASVVSVLAPVEVSPPAAPVLTLEPITPELLRKGYHVCNPHDPIGLGAYRPWAALTSGRALIPQQGGCTEDHGFDVLAHFHGHRAARIVFVQVSTGTTFVGADFGVGSHVYSSHFATRHRFPHMLRSLTKALKQTSGYDDAHIRRLTLSAWSAGYGAINEILRLHGDERVDAVVLLDGLHASWNAEARHRRGPESVVTREIKPILTFAEKAVRGEKLFVLTHSQVRTASYVSTRLTADRMLLDFGLERRPVDPGDDPFGKVGTVDVKGLHVWSYRGTDEMAHCSHLRHLAEIVRDVLEPTFGTPSMNRNVPATKAPSVGVPARRNVVDGGLSGISEGAREDREPNSPASATPDGGLSIVLEQRTLTNRRQ